MSTQEASWHEHHAGMRAAAKARQDGANPAAIDAIAGATAGIREIGGFRLMPASQGTLWTLQRIGREFTTWAESHGLPSSGNALEPATRELIELGLTTLIFCDARKCWRDVEEGRIDDLVSRAEDLIWTLPIDEQLALQAHFTREMDRIQQLSLGTEDEVGKQQAPGRSGSSPGIPIPPAAPGSP